MAPKSKFNPDYYNDWAWSLAIQGMTIAEIGKAMGVSRATINRWMAENEDFKKAIDDGRDTSDAKVEKSLYQRAIGYTYKEKKVIMTLDKDGNQMPARIETTEKHVPPDTTAQIFWLKNRKRDRYKDKWDMEVNTDKEIVFNIVGSKEYKEEES